MSDTADRRPPVSNIPVPDPSVLTTENLRREVSALKELLDVRLSAMDRATRLLHENLTRVPTEADRQIMHLRDLHDERFRSIEKQFSERDIRSAAAEDAAKVAVNAALQAQKEAAAAQNNANAASITKSEAATVKQIDSILALVAANNGSLIYKIATINARLDRSEGKEVNSHTSQASLITIIAVGVAMASLGFTIFSNSAARNDRSVVISPAGSVHTVNPAP